MGQKKTDENKSISAVVENSLLSNSSTMLGFCFVIISYLQATKLADTTIIDELTAIATVFFMINCIMSFLGSMYARFQTRRFINLNKFIFLAGLILMFGIIVAIIIGAKGL